MLEFEKIILKYLLNNKTFFNKTFNIIKKKYFKDTYAGDIFYLIKKYYTDYKEPPNFESVLIEVKNMQNSERRSNIASALRDIYNYEEGNANLSFLCDETLKWVKDALYEEALMIGAEGLETRSDELKQKAERILDERAKVTIDTDVGLEFSSLDSIDYYMSTKKGILTHHFSINDRLGSGFLPGTLSLILAASGVGKSLLMTDLISGFIKKGLNVLLVSLEMSQLEVMKRVHSNVLNIPIYDFEPQRFNKELFLSQLSKNKVGKFYAKDYPACSFSSSQLEGLVETFKNEKDITFDIILVDYLGIMKSDLVSQNVGLYSYIKSISEELRATAKRLNLPIISASQLNRSATNSVKTDNSAVSDSYGTVMTADFMLFLLQTDEMKAKGEIIAQVTKNRFTGKTDTFLLKVDYTHMKFIDPNTPVMVTSSDIFNSFEDMKDYAKTEINKIHLEDEEKAKTKDEELTNIFKDL